MPRKSADRLSIISQVMTDEECTLSILVKLVNCILWLVKHQIIANQFECSKCKCQCGHKGY